MKATIFSHRLLLIILLSCHLTARALVAVCTDPAASCINGVCNSTTSRCQCPSSGGVFLAFTDSRCDNVSVLTPAAGAAVTNLTQDAATFVQSSRINFVDSIFQGGFPIASGVRAMDVFVCSNGYVTFGSNFCTSRVDLLLTAAAPAFVAPLATSLDYRSAVGGVASTSVVSYQLVPSIDSDTGPLKLMRDNVSQLAGATSAIVVTWSKMSPPTLDQSAPVQRITMQQILFTDRYNMTVVAMLYSENSLKPYFDWVPTIVAWKNAGIASLVTLGNRRTSSMAYVTQRVAIGGLNARLRLLTLYRNATDPVVSYAGLCSDEYSKLLPAPVTSAIVGACPPTWRPDDSSSRAGVVGTGGDPRYSIHATATVGRQAVKLVATSGVENATQLTCVYHGASGGLLVQESSVDIVNNNVSLGGRLFDHCCRRASDMCHLYYKKFPQPSSTSFAAPTVAGFVTGAGLFRTFDNQQYKFMEPGMYWLAVANDLGVQVRLECLGNASSMANSTGTAAVTAAVVKFTGATNATVEIWWNSPGGIDSWLYSINQRPQVVVNASISRQTVVIDNAVVYGTNSRLVCYTMNSATWLEILSGSNGATVSLFVDKARIGNLSGPLGNADNNSGNDVAFRNGSALNESQLRDQASVNEAVSTWSVMVRDESLFQAAPATTLPVRPANWTAQHWNPVWDVNATALHLDLFADNWTTFNASLDACASQSANTTTHRFCVLEFSHCLADSFSNSSIETAAECSSRYLALLDSTPAALKDLGCSPPSWNATYTVDVADGVAFSMQLSAAVLGDSVNTSRAYFKVDGPAGMSVSSDGVLAWLPNQTDTMAPILVGLMGNATDGECGTSLWPMRLRLTRRAGLCVGNATEKLAAITEGATTLQNQVTISSCVCNSNYYGANCSEALCPLECYSCNAGLPTECSSTCPANYIKSVSDGLTICAYQDRCNLTACLGGNYTACVSLDPALQTDNYKYQCSCSRGYQYPLANSADKTRCEDIDECLYPAHCNTSQNRTCANSLGGFSCNCRQGYQLNAADSCVDTDECALNASICSNGNCSNTVGSFRCICSPGFYQETAQKCSDINECANPFAVNCTHQCVNTAGGFNCSCFNGFVHPTGSAVVCAAEFGCNSSSTCTYKELCAKVDSADKCHCLRTQTLSRDTTCSPTTFCTEAICGSSSAGTCTESNPGYVCTCKAHHELDSNSGKCSKIPYCSDPTRYPSVCPAGGPIVCSTNATTNAPSCICASGYGAASSVRKICEDIDECSNASLNACHQVSTECDNTVRSYNCQCRFGYRRLNATHCAPAQYVYQVVATFADLTYSSDLAGVNTAAFRQTADLIQKRLEAAFPPDGSGTPTIRVFSMASGSVVATTIASYETPTTVETIRSSASSSGLAVTVTTNVNECSNAALNNCTNEHNCHDTPSGFTCQCKSGYTQTGIRSGFPPTKLVADCLDIDECLTECRNGTGDNRACFNSPGNYTCTCTNGTYSPNPKTEPCQDPCVVGRCQNGGACQYQKSEQFPYKCVCPAGFAGFNCELTDQHYSAMRLNAIIIGSVLGALLLIALVILIICIVVRRQQPTKSSPDQQPVVRQLETRESQPPAPSSMAAASENKRQAQSRGLAFSDNSLDRNSEGNYRNVQAIPMVNTAIPRVRESAKHPSAYENRGYDRETVRRRNDYF